MYYVAIVDGGGGEASGTRCYCSGHLSCNGREREWHYELPEWCTTSNMAEYVAVIAALENIKQETQRGQATVLIRSDSKLVVMQCQKKWKVKARHLRRFRSKVLELMGHFKEVVFEWTPRDEIEMVLGH